MRKSRLAILLAVGTMAFSTAFFSGSASAQLAGSRGGAVGELHGEVELPLLEPEAAGEFITIEGTAELRVVATQLRVVLALSSEGDTALECRASIESQINATIEGWKGLGIPAESIHEDFIAILPRYQWQIETQGDSEVAIERLVGYRMQVNLHVAAEGEEQANDVIGVAYKNNLTDIIAFDYWHPELDEFKKQALREAIGAAKEKSEIVLSGLFDERLPVINVQEKTVAYFPDSLYQSFSNSYSESIDFPRRHDLPSIAAWRAQNTYYRGLRSNADSTPEALALRPEITIVSRVRLYYRSPAAAVDQEK